MNTNCGICNEKIVIENGLLDPRAFVITCKKHDEYKFVFQTEIIKKKLGFISEYSDRMTKCDICNCKLSNEEIESVELNDFNVTCTKHREVRKWFQTSIAKEWFEYKEIFSNANYEEGDWSVKFYKWKQEQFKTKNN
ncbi:MAG TPA: hypothetical protein VN026_13585 [Bacteroidia bacterium]|jgi:hypothetical protein|nr:hypothetical protein [Bacteroidia bacterium]